MKMLIWPICHETGLLFIWHGLDLRILRHIKAQLPQSTFPYPIMHRIFRPTGYKKPSFASAYAKAAGRYKMGVGAFPTYAYDEGEDTVVRVHSIDNVEHSTKVPAASHQTGVSSSVC